jgi:hypothetical protein
MGHPSAGADGAADVGADGAFTDAPRGAFTDAPCGAFPERRVYRRASPPRSTAHARVAALARRSTVAAPLRARRRTCAARIERGGARARLGSSASAREQARGITGLIARRHAKAVPTSEPRRANTHAVPTSVPCRPSSRADARRPRRRDPRDDAGADTGPLPTPLQSAAPTLRQLDATWSFDVPELTPA